MVCPDIVVRHGTVGKHIIHLALPDPAWTYDADGFRKELNSTYVCELRPFGACGAPIAEVTHLREPPTPFEVPRTGYLDSPPRLDLRF